MNFPSPFSGDSDLFDGYDEYVPETIPDSGPFLEGTDLLTGREHAAFHRLTRDVFERRGVYDMTFNYNLARLNLDTRHPNAGFRYAVETDSGAGRDADGPVLRAEFTPTTPYCPQSRTLTVAACRAWNGLAHRHEYDRVRVRVAPMHHESTPTNEHLSGLPETVLANDQARGETDPQDAIDVGSPDDTVPL